MTIEYQHGGEHESIPCENGVFLVGCSYTDATGYHISTMDDEDALKSLAAGLSCNVIDRHFPDGAHLHLILLSSESPSIRAIMERYAGVKLSELSCKDFSLTVIN